MNQTSLDAEDAKTQRTQRQSSKIFALFAPFAFFALNAVSAQAAALDKLKAFVEGTKSGKADFIQTVVSKSGRKDRKSTRLNSSHT